jgi:hypothetical protein
MANKNASSTVLTRLSSEKSTDRFSLRRAGSVAASTCRASIVPGFVARALSKDSQPMSCIMYGYPAAWKAVCCWCFERSGPTFVELTWSFADARRCQLL